MAKVRNVNVTRLLQLAICMYSYVHSYDKYLQKHSNVRKSYFANYVSDNANKMRKSACQMLNVLLFI